MNKSLFFSLDTNTLNFLFLHIVRSERVLQSALSYLAPEHFYKANELLYSVIWACIKDFYHTYKQFPSRQALLPLVVTRVKMLSAVDESIIQKAELLVNWLYDKEENPDNCLNEECALGILKYLLYDRKVGKLLETTLEKRSLGGVVQFSDVISKLFKLDIELQSVESKSIPLPVCDVWGSPSTGFITTGLPFVDKLLDGGIKSNDVNILLGPTGVAKTLLGIQLAVSYARRQNAVELSGGKGKLVLFFSYEDDLQSLRVRTISCAANILRSRLESSFAIEQLSTSNNLQTYEENYYNRLGVFDDQKRLGEQERFKMAAPWLNRYLRLIDFSGAKLTSIGGNGGLMEIPSCIEQIRLQTNMEPGLVIIDWAGMLVRRYLRVLNKLDKLVLELIDFVDNVGNFISGVYNCPVWVIHQLRGMANKKPPTVLSDHSEAEWCASFAVNAINCLVLGTKDLNTNTCLLGATKTRRGASHPPILCHIDGAFGKLRPAENDYMLDVKKKQIIVKQVMDEIDNPIIL